MAEGDAAASAGGEPPEVEFLLCCARTRIGPETADRIRSLIRGGRIDWDVLVAMAQGHGTAPLLFRALQPLGPEYVPAAVLERLRVHHLSSASNALALTGELLAILDLFRAHGIVALPFKGPLLAATAYGGLSLRQFGDLDLMVRPDDMASASELLKGRGYRAEGYSIGQKWGQEAGHLQSLMEYNLPHISGRGIVVELHWAFGEKFHAFDPGAWWERLRTSPLSGAEVPDLPTEETLAILCVHGARHRWERLTWICDVAELIRARPSIDWERALRLASERRVRRLLLLGLSLAQTLLDAELPEDVARRIRAERSIEALSSQVRKGLFRKPGGTPGLLERPFTFDGITLEMALFHIRSREKLRDKLRFASYVAQFSLTPNPRDRAWMPGPLACLAPLLRPIRLLGVYASMTLRKLADQLRAPRS